MTPRELAEYRALRETIRERGTARLWIFIAGLVAWAGLVIATAALAALPVATLLPLLVLAGVFEAVVSLHVGVERIGRYIQVFFEDDPPVGVTDERDGASRSGVGVGPHAISNWEKTAMAFGRGYRGGATDPLFAAVFLAATLLNFVPVLIAEPVAIEVSVI